MQIESINQEQVSTRDRPQYETPRVKFMNEQEIFGALQVSVNAMSWWNGM
jgi:hypothetical protein